MEPELDVYNMLKTAYGASTHNFNCFEEAINRVDWDNIFEADGETYYCANDFVLIIESTDPLKEAWKPNVIFSDGSHMELLA